VSSLSTIGIAQALASAFSQDRSLIHFSQEHFKKPFMVQVGADMRRPPCEDDAPFIALFPDAHNVGGQGMAHSHELGIVAGIADAEWVDQGGIKTMRGLVRLNELCPMLEKTMRFALPKARGMELDIEFEIALYPLLQAIFTVTIDESSPIGRR
jgi:hypothetical protein